MAPVSTVGPTGATFCPPGVGCPIRPVLRVTNKLAVNGPLDPASKLVPPVPEVAWKLAIAFPSGSDEAGEKSIRLSADSWPTPLSKIFSQSRFAILSSH
jgi:hypothetical protein